MTMSLFDRVGEIARRVPEARALSSGESAVTYRDLVEEAKRRADEIARKSLSWVDLDGGDPVGFALDFFAAQLCGWPAVAVAHALPDAVHALRREALERRPPPLGATVFHSSGSVGPARAVPLSAKNLVTAALAYAPWNEIEPSDRIAVGVSPAQVLGFVRGVLNTLAVGAESVFFVPRRDPLSDAERLGASKVLVPSAFVALAARHASRPAVRALFCGGGAPDPAAVEAVEKIRGVAVRSGYGMTESAGLGSRQPLGRPARAGSVGLPAPGLEVVIAAPDGSLRSPGSSGEIRLAGPSVFAGYLSSEDGKPFDEAGRLRTGDVGFFDEAGELCVRGRLAFALSSGDRIVCAEEVEAAMAEHPAVLEAAVAPLESDFGVLVVRRDGGLETGELRAYAEKRLPSFARPRKIVAVPALPKTTAGKLDRAEASRWLAR